MPQIKCKDCGRTFLHDNPNAELCFSCAENEILRLKKQEENLDIKLNDCPEIADLLNNLSSEEILARLKARWYFSEFNPSINPEHFQQERKE